MRASVSCLAVSCMLLVASNQAIADPFSRMVVFGHGHVDTGNVYESVGGTDHWIVEFSDLLATELDALQTSPELTIYHFDAISLVQQVRSDSTAFGFVNATEPAFPLPDNVVPNPDE